jgi:hypothetical protein
MRGHLRAGLAVSVAIFLIQMGRSSAAEAINFEKDVEPIFAAHCIKCHGADKQKSKFR